MNWKIMTMNMRRMSRGRNRKFSEWNGSRRFPGSDGGGCGCTDYGETEVMRKDRAFSARAGSGPVRFRQDAIRRMATANMHSRPTAGA